MFTLIFTHFTDETETLPLCLLYFFHKNNNLSLKPTIFSVNLGYRNIQILLL